MDNYQDFINTSMEKKDLFNYYLILFAVVVVFSILNPPIITLIAILVAGSIILLLRKNTISQISSTNQELDYKLNSLFPAPKYFYLSASAIEFFFRMKDFYQYNKQAYADALLATDNVLKIYADVSKGIISCTNWYEVASDQKDLAVNNIQSFIHSMPIQQLTVLKHNNALFAIQLILNRIMDDIKKICQAEIIEKGVSKNTRFPPEQWPHAKPFDTDREQDVNFYIY